MASQNERMRWERWYDQVMARMERQKKSLDRVVLMLTEAMAALEEIAALDPVDKEGYNKARDRAKFALDRIKDPAAAEHQNRIESEESEEPVSDPRRRH